MQQLPLVGAELQRVTSGFRDVARELTAARQALADIDVAAVGATGVDAAVDGGLHDLAMALHRLEATASTCVQALSHSRGIGTSDEHS